MRSSGAFWSAWMMMTRTGSLSSSYLQHTPCHVGRLAWKKISKWFLRLSSAKEKNSCRFLIAHSCLYIYSISIPSQVFIYIYYLSLVYMKKKIPTSSLPPPQKKKEKFPTAKSHKTAYTVYYIRMIKKKKGHNIY